MLTCVACQQARPDALQRLGPKPDGRWPLPGHSPAPVDPVLCTDCCGQAPGRGWMVGRDERPAPLVASAASVPVRQSRAARTGRRSA